MVTAPDMRVNLNGLELINPVITASGTFGYGQEFVEFYDPALLGAVAVKGLSLKPRPGNPPPRITETSQGMINAIGLENVGVEEFVSSKLPWLIENKVTVIVNIFGETVGEYKAVAQRLSKADGVSMIEVNVSCPNVEHGGLVFGTDPIVTAEVVRAVAGEVGCPVMVKLTPMVSDIVAIAEAAVEAGASAISLINTVPAMAVNLETKKPVLANTVGGLSGPAIKPIALKLVWQAARALDVPVVGGGGIMTAEDALEFLLVGATAVQVGTASFVDPMAALNIVIGIKEYLEKNNVEKVTDWIGSLQT